MGATRNCTHSGGFGVYITPQAKNEDGSEQFDLIDISKLKMVES
jgi:hypothetical protein